MNKRSFIKKISGALIAALSYLGIKAKASARDQLIFASFTQYDPRYLRRPRGIIGSPAYSRIERGMGAAIGVEFCSNAEQLAKYEENETAEPGTGYAENWVGVVISDRASPEDVADGFERLARAIRNRTNFTKGEEWRSGSEIDARTRCRYPERDLLPSDPLPGAPERLAKLKNLLGINA